MSEETVTWELINPNQDVAVIRPCGSISLACADRISRIMHECFSQECFKIIVDLAGVSYISSAGWGIFISEINKIRHQQGDLKLAAMVQETEDVYRILEFDAIIKSYPTVDAARQDFK